MIYNNKNYLNFSSPPIFEESLLSLRFIQDSHGFSSHRDLSKSLAYATFLEGFFSCVKKKSLMFLSKSVAAHRIVYANFAEILILLHPIQECPQKAQGENRPSGEEGGNQEGPLPYLLLSIALPPPH
ncbi:MAG: hypothetical protein ACFNOP_04500, partial [Bacteroides sp.]